MTAPLNTASLVASWREAMGGVTPGPWIKVEDDSFDETILVTTEERNGNRCPISATAAGFTEPFDSEQRANAAWIARCSPAGISALLDALESTSRALSEKEGELAEARRSARNNRDGRLAEKDRAETATRQRDEALAALKASEERGAEAIEALEQCEEYFDNRADADCDQDGFIPNKEMRLLSVIRGALKALETRKAPLADATKKDPGTEQREAGRG